MSNSNNEKGASNTVRLLYFPGVRIPDDTKTVDLDNADDEEKDRLALIESQREALKAYFRTPGADRNKVIGEAEHCNIRIKTPNRDVPIIEFMSKVYQKKPVLSLVG